MERLALVRLAPKYLEVRARPWPLKTEGQAVVCSKENGLAKELGGVGKITEEGDEKSYEVHLEAGSSRWLGGEHSQLHEIFTRGYYHISCIDHILYHIISYHIIS